MPPPGRWPPPPPQGPPPWSRQTRSAKLLLGGLAILAIVVTTVATTLLITRESSNSSITTRATNADPTGMASADDFQPVTIITDEPTCSTWNSINDSLAAAQQNGWQHRDPSLPASVWNSQQRSEYTAVAKSFSGAADRAIVLSNQTPHRTVRYIYEQFSAYAKAYADIIPLYEPSDDHLARVTIGASLAINSICNAIEYDAASARALLVKPTGSEVSEVPPSSGNHPSQFVTAWDSECSDWVSLVTQYSADIANWQSTDPRVSAAQWDSSQKAINDLAIPVMESFADTAAELGAKSDTPTLRDLAMLAAQYRRTFAASIPTYTPADNYLNEAATGLTGVIYEACLAVAAS